MLVVSVVKKKNVVKQQYFLSSDVFSYCPEKGFLYITYINDSSHHNSYL